MEGNLLERWVQKTLRNKKKISRVGKRNVRDTLGRNLRRKPKECGNNGKWGFWFCFSGI